MEQTSDELEKRIEDAARAVDEIERQISAEISAAREAIEAKFADQLNAARAARSAARAAKEAANVAASQSHPLLGKRVQRKVRKGGYSWRTTTMVDQFGIVEIFTRQSVVPANMGRWRAPSVGTPIVRILKKDGSPGAKIERLTHEWKAA